jgi:hypothetical protein
MSISWLTRPIVLTIGIVLLVLAVVLVVFYRASQHVPEFYREALAAEPQAQAQAADTMFRKATSLNNDVQRVGQWQAVFTAEEINGWLAVELPRLAREQPDLLPTAVHDPRVAIDPDGVTVAARLDRGGFSSVVALKLDVYVSEASSLVLRIRKVRVGAVPWSPRQVLDTVVEAARRAQRPVKLSHEGSDPIVLVPLSAFAREMPGKRLQVDTVKLESGKICVAGTTVRGN